MSLLGGENEMERRGGKRITENMEININKKEKKAPQLGGSHDFSMEFYTT